VRGLRQKKPRSKKKQEEKLPTVGLWFKTHEGGLNHEEGSIPSVSKSTHDPFSSVFESEKGPDSTCRKVCGVAQVVCWVFAEEKKAAVGSSLGVVTLFAGCVSLKEETSETLLG
jgi:hypothetical protein